jgi:type VII secretion-associated protein (TIGR03931 family)
MRLAVQVGGARAGLAVSEGPDGPARLLPARSVADLDAVAATVREAADRWGSPDDPLEQLVVVHPVHWEPPLVRATESRLVVPGVPVVARSSLSAAAAELAARSGLPPGPLAVLQVGPSGACAGVLAGTEPGELDTVLAVRHSPAEGDAVRLLAEAAVLAGTTVPGLSGGVLVLADERRSGTLADPLTDLAGEPPLLPDDPGAVALLGALRPAPGPRSRLCPSSAPSGGCWSQSRPSVQPWLSPAPGPSAGPAHPARRLPPPPPRRRARTLLAAATLPVLAAALTALGTGLAPSGGPAARVATPDPRATLVQYDYAVRLPDGWRHTGGLAQRRRTLLTPAGHPEGSDLIAVEQTPLGYDSAAEPDRAFRELREQYRHEVDGGAELSDFTLATRVAGRNVIAYRQRRPGLGAQVDWYVLFDGDAQLSVGCQHTPSGVETVRSACAEVLGSLRSRP